MSWIKKTKFFFLFCAVILFVLHGLVLSENNALPFIYKNYPTYANNGKKDFDRASEELVLSRIDFEVLGLDYSSRFHLWRPTGINHEGIENIQTSNQNEERIIALLDGTAYRSQIGIQSWFHSKISKIIGQEFNDYQKIKGVSVFLFVIFLAVILTWIKEKIGFSAGLGSLVFSSFSTGFAVFSSSLYWSPFLFILPIAWVFGWHLFKWGNVWIMYFGLVPLLLLKFLSGYEFITVLGISLTIPFFHEYIYQKTSFPWLKLSMLFLAFVIAFILSLAIYQWNFQMEFGESGFAHLFGRSESWSMAGLGEKGVEPLSQLIKIVLLNTMDVNGYGIPLILFFVGVGIAAFVFRKSISKEDSLMVGLVLLGSLSWFIVQFGHMLFHPRYTTFVLAFPLGLFLSAYIGKWMHVYLEKKQDDKS